jgi:glycosyltransferase involved in cell wall biosynthesis
MQILMFIHSISRSSGGLSSSWDLADAFYRNGYKVVVVVNSKHLFHKKHLLKVSNNPHYLLLNRKYQPRGTSKGTIRSRIRNVLITLSGNDFRLQKALSEAKYVIDASMLNQSAIQKIKSVTKGEVIRNHAGSPVSFVKHWLTNRQDLYETNPEARYLEYCSWFDGLLFQSRVQEDDYLKRAEGLKSICNTYLLRPSCQEEKLSAVKQANRDCFDGLSFNVVIVASIQWIKGIDLALEVLREVRKEVPHIHFHFVGKWFKESTPHGDYYRDQKAYITEYDLNKHCTFHGFKRNFLDYMNTADLILQPSREEGVSRILRESMFLKKLILAFAISGTKDLLENNVSAILVTPENVNEMAKALKNIVEISAEQRERLINKSFENYMKRNSIKAYDQQLKTIFN